MAERRPLVLIDGTPVELPAGDRVPGSGLFPFYLADGSADPIRLVSDGPELPFHLADGSASNIPLVN